MTLGGIERSNQSHWFVYHRQCIIRQRSCQAERLLVDIIRLCILYFFCNFYIFQAIFLGSGPGFKSGYETNQSFDNVELYNLMAGIGGFNQSG